MNQSKVSIFDFSGIYDHEGFYREFKSPRFICLKDLPGTNCLCDDLAVEAIKKAVLTGDHDIEDVADGECLGDNGADADKNPGLPEKGIRFFDSGNYHYMSKILADFQDRPFNLIVYDHHPDMQPTSFGNILSCGSWVMDLLDTNKFIQKVVIIGAAEHLIREVDPSYLDRVTFLTHKEAYEALDQDGGFADWDAATPVYLSIDKDVLDVAEITTNWDQGDMSVKDLYKQIDMIYNAYCVVATDVCGECAVDQEDCDVAQAAAVSSDINAGIYEIWRRYNK